MKYNLFLTLIINYLLNIIMKIRLFKNACLLCLMSIIIIGICENFKNNKVEKT